MHSTKMFCHKTYKVLFIPTNDHEQRKWAMPDPLIGVLFMDRND